ncbi:AI-2E family transporter [Archangium violaceum]|uniref:AI-2E family transporter n=1 Tax=Archangium violaceum TaxID=83451 RepID=UPI0036DB640D
MGASSSKRDSPRQVVRVEVSPRSLWWVVAFLAGGWLLVQLWEILVLVLVSLVLVGTFAPVVAWWEKRGLSRSLAVLGTFVGVLLLFGLVGLLTVPALVRQTSSLLSQVPEYREHVADWMRNHRLLAPLAESVHQGSASSALLSRAVHYAISVSERAAVILGYGGTALVLAFYLIADGERVRGALYAVMPRRYHLRLARILLNLETIVGGYMRGQLITSAAITLFTFVLLTVLGVPNPLALAVFAGVTDVLPFIGGLLGTTPAALSALSRGVVPALVVVAAMMVYQEFESRVLVPRVYGKALRLPAVVVILALLIGGTLLGIIGALLALPLAAALRMILRELRVEFPGEAEDHSDLRERDENAERTYAHLSAGAPAQEAAAIAVDMADRIRHADADTAEHATEVPITGGYSEQHGEEAHDDAHDAPARSGEQAPTEAPPHH